MAKDVCLVLEISDPHTAYTRLDATGKSYRGRTTVGMRPGRPVMLINESGLYYLILRSDKPEAKRFQDWVTREVLPRIRKTESKEIVPVQSMSAGPVQGGNELTPFNYKGRAIRVVQNDKGEPEWVAKDVVEAMGKTWKGNAGSIAHVPEEWKGVCSVQTTFKNAHRIWESPVDMITLTEPGLYFYLNRSDSPYALPFFL